MRHETIIFTFQIKSKSNLLFYNFTTKNAKTNKRMSTDGDVEVL